MIENLQGAYAPLMICSLETGVETAGVVAYMQG